MLFTFFPLYAGKSFVELVRYLFKIPVVNSFLSQRICQDPLERFFDIQRQRGGVYDNHSAREFMKNTQALRVVKSVKTSLKRGNCRGAIVEQEDSSTPLPKRKRQSRHYHYALINVLCMQCSLKPLLFLKFTIIQTKQLNYFSSFAFFAVDCTDCSYLRRPFDLRSLHFNFSTYALAYEKPRILIHSLKISRNASAKDSDQSMLIKLQTH